MYQIIKKEKYQLSYQVFGSGSLKMLTFHGFGQESSVYKSVPASFPSHTIYSIDLFFHGKSEWSESLDSLDFMRWKTIMEEFIHLNQIDTFDLLGFSMGGRFALLMAGVFPQKLNTLYLLAPDGIQMNAWYRVATKFTPLQPIFKYFTHAETNVYKKLVKNLGKYGLINKTVLKLAETEMATPQKRRRVYQTWMLYRFLEIDIKKLAESLNKHHVKVQFFLGKYDKLVHSQTIKPFTRLLENVQIEVLDCGHHRLISAVMESVA